MEDSVFESTDRFPPRWQESIRRSRLGTVGSVVGREFEMTVRILNPVYAHGKHGATSISWHELADQRGVTPDFRECRFRDVSGVELQSGRTTRQWDVEPAVGGDPRVLLHLCDILRPITPESSGLGLALWEGYAELRRVSREVPRFRIGVNREYLQLRPTSIGQVVDPVGVGRPANLCWSESGGWLVASDIDLPCTYVACPGRIGDRILNSPFLEAVEVRPELSR